MSQKKLMNLRHLFMHSTNTSYPTSFNLTSSSHLIESTTEDLSIRCNHTTLTRIRLIYFEFNTTHLPLKWKKSTFPTGQNEWRKYAVKQLHQILVHKIYINMRIKRWTQNTYQSGRKVTLQGCIRKVPVRIVSSARRMRNRFKCANAGEFLMFASLAVLCVYFKDSTKCAILISGTSSTSSYFIASRFSAFILSFSVSLSCQKQRRLRAV